MTEQTVPSPRTATAEEIAALAATIDFDDPTLPVSYGSKAQKDVAAFADEVLSGVRMGSAGPVGKTLEDLFASIGEVDPDDLTKKGGTLASLPLVGRFFDSAKRTVARFDTVLGQVEKLSDQLETAMLALLKDVKLLDRQFAHNESFYHDLSDAIAAGELRLEQARSVELPALEAKAKESGDAFDAQRVRDFADRLNRFDRRLHDLRLSRTVTVQTAPQIRMVQSNDQELAEKLQSSILTAVPLWKNQMVLALSIYRQHRASKLQQSVSDTTNEMIRKNSELLGEASTRTAREVERSVVDIETLKEAQQRLVDTISETLDIARQGRERRRAAEGELVRMENELRERLASLAARKAEDTVEAARG